MNWYVLHVLTGGELEAHRQLKELGYFSIVLQETILIRRGGKWHDETRILFPGYVFVHMRYTPAAHHDLKRVTGAIRLLPKEKPYPLTAEESAWLISCAGELLKPSKVDFNGKTPRVVDGILKEWEPYIIKFDRHRRRAQLRVPVLGEGKDITLSILPV